MTKKHKKNKKNVRLKEDGEIISEDSESDKDVNHTTAKIATQQAGINKDAPASAVALNAPYSAVIRNQGSQGSQGSSEQHKDAMETTTNAPVINKDSIGSEKTNTPCAVEQLHQREETTEWAPTIPGHPPITQEDIRKESTEKEQNYMLETYPQIQPQKIYFSFLD